MHVQLHSVKVCTGQYKMFVHNTLNGTQWILSAVSTNEASRQPLVCGVQLMKSVRKLRWHDESQTGRLLDSASLTVGARGSDMPLANSVDRLANSWQHTVGARGSDMPLVNSVDRLANSWQHRVGARRSDMPLVNSINLGARGCVLIAVHILYIGTVHVRCIINNDDLPVWQMCLCSVLHQLHHHHLHIIIINYTVSKALVN